ncbi:MAG: YraN family protein [Eggerthella lenta]
MNAEELKPKAIKASERFLESRGYEILETSWECTAGGADIIARDDADVVFVEVNAKTNTEAGFPAEAGTEAKRAKFERTAIAYMAGYEETRRVRPLRHHLDGDHRRKPRDAPPPHQRTVTRSGLTTSGPLRASSGPPGATPAGLPAAKASD